MRIHFYAPNRIEPWTWSNVVHEGIGGSETSHVEMAMRLAARGHDVVSYTDLPGTKVTTSHAGVVWADLSEARLDDDGLWIVYRAPDVGLQVTPTPTRRYWLMCQDVWYPQWTPGAVEAFDRVIGLCPRHVTHIKDQLLTDDGRAKVCLSSNGVNVDRVPDVVPARDPHRLIWSSSPDRGLAELLPIFTRAREFVPTLSLHCYYGMDNIDKLCGGDHTRMPWKPVWDTYDLARRTPGVVWHGRVGQFVLTNAFFGAGIWCYPTWFSETSCISCMEAQCFGAIPITNPIWATAHNVTWGTFIEGDPRGDALTRARYAAEIVRWATMDPNMLDRYRTAMMTAARERFDWEVYADQWRGWIGELEARRVA